MQKYFLLLLKSFYIIMALRQFASKCGSPVWSYLTTFKAGQTSIITNSTSRILNSTNPIKEVKITSGILNKLNASNIHSSPGFIDFVANNLNKRLYTPTNTINSIKVYNDININPILIEDRINRVEILDPQTVVKKEAIRMINIRRKKMKKHKLIKLRKKMKFVFAKIRMRKELRIEQAFRTELLTKVEAADKFDAAEYVRNILDTIRYQPRQRTVEEEVERRRQLKKVNKYQTTFVKPRFDY
ncbi:hypothetical protein JTE90_008619 [Oedothorax gibbosus]|uniref:Ribosomal protein mS38 C-terminal domain-containing protein n=1 Tax=Oedothorax gibbosus TaxID=931172 RepID=A0AAV6UCI6_9ARAC|nr:hypothetical protein JTE90_008619 [Oedothorax gibbosus]